MAIAKVMEMAVDMAMAQAGAWLRRAVAQVAPDESRRTGDVAGAETSSADPGGLALLVRNHAHELLHALFISKQLDEPQEHFKQEGLAWVPVDAPSNARLLAALDGPARAPASARTDASAAAARTRRASRAARRPSPAPRGCCAAC